MAPAQRVPRHFRVREREGRGTGHVRVRPRRPTRGSHLGVHGIADPACPSQTGRTIEGAAPAAAGDGKVRQSFPGRGKRGTFS